MFEDPLSSPLPWPGRCPSASARTHARVRADASVLPPGNFKKDATVRLSHGRPRGHRPTVRPSVHYRPLDNPANEAQDSVKKACALGRKPRHPFFFFCTTPDNFRNSYKGLQPFGEGKKRQRVIVRQAMLNIPIDIVEEHLGGEVHFKRSIKRSR
jgi:hypothetical protein